METFDFETYEDGKLVTVEVDFYYEEPDRNNRDSDWDYYGGIWINAVRTYVAGVETSVHVPAQEVLMKLKRYIEDTQTTEVMLDNESF